MHESTCKREGVEVVRREMAFVKGFVTCTNCGACYDQNIEPRFCQKYALTIDPAATDENIVRAEACAQWAPKGLDRSKIVLPDHVYRYEKWDDDL